MLPLLIICLLFIIALLSAIILIRHKREQARKRQERIDLISRIAPDIKSALADISAFYNYSHYITESERCSLCEKYKHLFKAVSPLMASKEMEESPKKEVFQRFYKAMNDSVQHKKVNNEHFIEKQLSKYSKYFDTVLPHPLDPQQRDAIVSLEDNVLVISSAGSGKTMTTVGKVRYLIDVQGIDPSKILLITFTRKAAESLSERLGEDHLKCRTFHKLAIDIISEVTGEKPSITSNDFSVQVYHNLYDNSPTFRQAMADYIIRARYKMKDQFEYASMKDYIQDRKVHGIQAFFKDMDGHPVFCKSDEESQICDFLGVRGVAFRYEEKYEHKTVDREHRQYCPDFSIYFKGPDGQIHRVYLEHFAVNEYGRCPSFFTAEEEIAYKEGIQWKRRLHNSYHTILLETSSAGFHRGDVFENLASQLKALGVKFSEKPNPYVSRELIQQEESILNTLTAFNFLLKSRDKSIESVQKEVSNGQDRFTLNQIVIPFVQEYEKAEKERKEIDFTDAIITATKLCDEGYAPDYDYILVDEFQDISIDRYKFLQSLRRKNPLTKLFCVGDDWQSIYRFAGSDMALFRYFERYFGYTKKCFMETTYRFGEPAIGQSSKFILANPAQEPKKVHSFTNDIETKLDFLPASNKEDMVRLVKHLVDDIPEGKEIYLLGRYSFDIRIFQGSDIIIEEDHDATHVVYGNRKMTYLTVHKSKGLEADYVILLNCNSGGLGFPSTVADSPVLKYVLSEPDEFAFSEERRIFYVGITRAKIHTWVLYDINSPSPFVTEFIRIKTTNAIQDEPIPEAYLCPKCGCGKVRIKTTGTAKNGNPYYVKTCSNYKYGCDYNEMVFVNLNAPRKKKSV